MRSAAGRSSNAIPARPAANPTSAAAGSAAPATTAPPTTPDTSSLSQPRTASALPRRSRRRQCGTGIPSGRTGSAQRAPSRRAYVAMVGRRRRIAIVTAGTLAVLLVAGAGAAWAYERHLNARVARTDAFAGLPTDRPTD